MEFRCNGAAMRAVAALRADWVNVRDAIRKAMRRAREQSAKSVKPKPGDADKLARAQAALSTWQAKAKRAETAIRKYRRRVNYYARRTQRNNAEPTG